MSRKFKYITLLGYDTQTGSLKGKGLFYFILLFVTIIGNILFVIKYWNNMDDKINALKSLTLISVIGSISATLVINWKVFIMAVEFVESNYYKFPYNYTTERHNLLQDLKVQLTKENDFTRNTAILFLLTLSLLPAVNAITLSMSTDYSDIDIEKLPLSYPCRYPFRFKSLFLYFVIYVLQSIFNAYVIGYVYVIYTTTFNSMQIVANEMKLLCLSLKEIQDMFSTENIYNKKITSSRRLHIKYEDLSRQICSKYDSDVYENSPKIYLENEVGIMKDYFRYFIRHHQYIFRKRNLVNNGIEWSAFVHNYLVSIFMCMEIYFIVQEGDILFKLSEGLLCIVAAYMTYLLDATGEKVITEGKTLRNTLYEFSWIDKPEWLKKSLLTIMVQSNRPVEIKPFGLYVLNLKNFAIAINAAYSYYNLLHTFNKNIN